MVGIKHQKRKSKQGSSSRAFSDFKFKLWRDRLTAAFILVGGCWMATMAAILLCSLRSTPLPPIPLSTETH